MAAYYRYRDVYRPKRRFGWVMQRLVHVGGMYSLPVVSFSLVEQRRNSQRALMVQ